MYDSGHRRAAIAVACAGAFIAFLDTTIVNIAFPDISASFSDSGRDALSWVLDGYFVVIAAFRQVGAVLGTAILVAIVGDPASLPEALSVSDDAYLFSVFAALASGAAALGLRRQRVPGVESLLEERYSAV